VEPSEDRSRFFLEDLRTGQFHEKAEKYIIKAQGEEELAHSDQFEDELHALVNVMTGLVYKFVFFFQGLQAGGLICILLMQQLLGLQLGNIAGSYQRIDQIIRLASLISCFGAVSTLHAAYLKALESESRQAASAPEDRKFYLLSWATTLFYAGSYVAILIQHLYTLNAQADPWQALLIVATVLAVVGWAFAVFNSQHFLERSFEDD
jgi:hypothetical protein